MSIITMIGGRETPKTICDELTKIGSWCKDNKIWVRSGHAEGADWVSEQGAQEYCIAYLPWEGFNKQLVSKAKLRVIEQTKELTALAKQHHPRWDSLSRGAKSLISRDGAQVLGEKLDNWSNLIVCWTPDWKQPSGGTSQAIRIAIYNDIEVVNMSNPNTDTSEKVISIIKLTCNL
jgi:hypothetical protein